MSSDESAPAVLVDGISKHYQGSRVGAMESSLREQVATVLTKPWRLLPGLRPRDHAEPVKALNPISFSVPKGQALGLIGPNGSGKSTLLKVLARITAPSTGEAEIRGRVASILEVGTGFHPDLTGYENIFLGGAILGLRRKDIAQAIDRIVAFAGVGDFLDLPVKRYSTGMYVRLAFSVAAHLDADVLLIDEVLAVGDEGFRDRCLARMREHVASGGSIVVVSHDITAIRQVCDRCLVLAHGDLLFDGEVEPAVAQYRAVCDAAPTAATDHARS